MKKDISLTQQKARYLFILKSSIIFCPCVFCFFLNRKSILFQFAGVTFFKEGDLYPLQRQVQLLPLFVPMVTPVADARLFLLTLSPTNAEPLCSNTLKVCGTPESIEKY